MKSIENNRSIDDQLEELITLNKDCFVCLETESYKNLLSLFERRNALTVTVLSKLSDQQKQEFLPLLIGFNNKIIKKINTDKSNCFQSMSDHYRQNIASKEYIEAQKFLLNCV